jgi:hypothetical protein
LARPDGGLLGLQPAWLGAVRWPKLRPAVTQEGEHGGDPAVDPDLLGAAEHGEDRADVPLYRRERQR